MIISCLVEYTKIISKIYRENLHLPTVNDHSVNGGHVTYAIWHITYIMT